jgi:hypothetical protein
MEELRKCWKVPYIVYFCNLFEQNLDIIDLRVDEFEEAIIDDCSSDQSRNIIIIHLIQKLLKPFLMARSIDLTNYEQYLLSVLKRYKLDHLYLQNKETNQWSELSMLTKLDIIYSLCELRLQLNDCETKLTDFEANELRIEPLGSDSKGNKLWYFGDLRLYEEKPATKDKTQRILTDLVESLVNPTPVTTTTTTTANTNTSSSTNTQSINNKKSKQQQKKTLKNKKLTKKKKKQQQSTSINRKKKRNNSTDEDDDDNNNVNYDDSYEDDDEDEEEDEPEDDDEYEQNNTIINNNEINFDLIEEEEVDVIKEEEDKKHNKLPTITTRRSRRINPNENEQKQIEIKKEEEGGEEEEKEQEIPVIMKLMMIQQQQRSNEAAAAATTTTQDNNKPIFKPVEEKEEYLKELKNWSCVCLNLEDWQSIYDKYSKSKKKLDIEIAKLLAESYLPEMPALFQKAEKERMHRLLSMAPKRQSQRLQSKQTITSNGDIDSNEDFIINNESSSNENSNTSYLLPLTEQEKLKREEIAKQRQERLEKRLLKKDDLLNTSYTSSCYNNNGDLTAGDTTSQDGVNVMVANNNNNNNNKKNDEFNIRNYFLMHKVLSKLLQCKYAWPFKNAVSEDEAPDYNKIIQVSKQYLTFFSLNFLLKAKCEYII